MKAVPALHYAVKYSPSRSAIHSAAGYSRSTFIELLVSAGQLSYSCWLQQVNLHRAASYSRSTFIELLASAGKPKDLMASTGQPTDLMASAGQPIQLS